MANALFEISWLAGCFTAWYFIVAGIRHGYIILPLFIYDNFFKVKQAAYSFFFLSEHGMKH